MPKKKKTILYLHVAASTKAWLKAQAKKELRTLSTMAEKLLVKAKSEARA